MAPGVLRPKPPKAETLAKRPHNRWCEHCKKWIHKDRFAQHSQSKHGLAVEAAVPVTPTVRSTVNKAGVTSVKQRIFIKKEAEDRFVEPLYERQPRFEGDKVGAGGYSGVG
jgi:hypothetical protein